MSRSLEAELDLLLPLCFLLCLSLSRCPWCGDFTTGGSSDFLDFFATTGLVGGSIALGGLSALELDLTFEDLLLEDVGITTGSGGDFLEEDLSLFLLPPLLLLGLSLPVSASRSRGVSFDLDDFSDLSLFVDVGLDEELLAAPFRLIGVGAPKRVSKLFFGGLDLLGSLSFVDEVAAAPFGLDFPPLLCTAA